MLLGDRAASPTGLLDGSEADRQRVVRPPQVDRSRGPSPGAFRLFSGTGEESERPGHPAGDAWSTWGSATAGSAVSVSTGHSAGSPPGRVVGQRAMAAVAAAAVAATTVTVTRIVLVLRRTGPSQISERSKSR